MSISVHLVDYEEDEKNNRGRIGPEFPPPERQDQGYFDDPVGQQVNGPEHPGAHTEVLGRPDQEIRHQVRRVLAQFVPGYCPDKPLERLRGEPKERHPAYQLKDAVNEFKQYAYFKALVDQISSFFIHWFGYSKILTRGHGAGAPFSGKNPLYY